MDDYISRTTLIEKINEQIELPYNKCHSPRSWSRAFCAFDEIQHNIPPADVIPRATIEAGIGEAIALLNAINGEGRLDYQAYSELHDAITDILPEKEADSDG